MAQKDATFNSVQLKLLCLKTPKREMIESSRGQGRWACHEVQGSNLAKVSGGVRKSIQP